jgi:outer membrane cobalamin receptor
MFATVGVPAIAQTEDEPVATTAPAEEAEVKAEKVTVTGSRLALQDFQAISPITSVTSEAIELNATLTIETLLNELPQVIPGNTVTSNNAGGEDFATIDLRGLGPSRTLVIVDGERVPGSSTTGVVDLNSIPAGLIDRIEVVTGGASAVYGSDAIAGVVNFILKDDYEGAQVTVGGGGGFDGNAQYETADFLLGGNFDNGRGNIVTYASYFNRDGVKQSQYDYSRVSAGVVYGYDSANSSYTAAYVVDTLWSESSRNELLKLVKGATRLYCDSFYAKAQTKEAAKHRHMLAPQAAGGAPYRWTKDLRSSDPVP